MWTLMVQRTAKMVCGEVNSLQIMTLTDIALEEPIMASRGRKAPSKGAKAQIPLESSTSRFWRVHLGLKANTNAIINNVCPNLKNDSYGLTQIC